MNALLMLHVILNQVVKVVIDRSGLQSWPRVGCIVREINQNKGSESRSHLSLATVLYNVNIG